MSMFAAYLLAFGAMVIVARGPFVFAPEATRSFALGILKDDMRMRLWGVAGAVLGSLAILAAQSGAGAGAVILKWFGVVVLAVSLGAALVFPGWARRTAHSVWNAMSVPALRAVGAVSVILGAAIIWYALTL